MDHFFTSNSLGRVFGFLEVNSVWKKWKIYPNLKIPEIFGFLDLGLSLEPDTWLYLFGGTLHLKSRARQREIYLPKYIHIFLLYIERWMGMNCPNLGKIIKHWWSDNFTRLSEIIHKVVQMLRAYIFWTKQIIEILLVRIMDASGWIFSRSAR